MAAGAKRAPVQARGGGCPRRDCRIDRGTLRDYGNDPWLTHFACGNPIDEPGGTAPTPGGRAARSVIVGPIGAYRRRPPRPCHRVATGSRFANVSAIPKRFDWGASMNRVLSRFRTIAGLAGLGLAILLVTPSDAWAYIDPGTGSYLFQIAAAGLLGAAYTLRRYWRVLASVVRGRSSDYRASDAGEPRE